MTLRLRTLFFIITGSLLIWFLYIERAILTPFILAAIFAYIFNPIVNFFYHKLKLPRIVTVIAIYSIIISLVVFSGFAFSNRVVSESYLLRQEVYNISKTAKNQINYLPDWAKPTIVDTLSALEKTSNITYPSIFTFAPKAFSRVLSLIIFLFAAFYFLKEGRNMIDKILNFVPGDYRVEVDILTRKINSILGSYLRGQIFLVFFVSSVLFIILTILGVKFSFILAVFSGFAEIVPIIGPIVATAVAALVAFVGGTTNFNLAPIQLSIAVIIVYFIVRQVQDYFVNPYIMGKITKLHPLVILFSVIAGEHIAGILGLILAVPIAGVIRIIFEYSLEKVSKLEEEVK
ncbi:MAG TPA: AI-2E family transporter [Candidatus Sulfotelmatobacter sp.]|nr:AI-2E family transporter [Candidatus Sulfotelmatobacter sp.]